MVKIDFEKKQMLLVVGCPRSGTAFMAHLLRIPHEPNFRDDCEAETKGWTRDAAFRKMKVAVRYKGDERESNGSHLPFIKEIKERFPQATILGIVRHPAKTIRSLISCGHYEADAPHYKRIPMEVNFWERLSQFERCCWFWRKCSEKMRENDIPILKLEQLRGPKINALPPHFPPFEEWTSEQREKFYGICGEEMKFYGYE